MTTSPDWADADERQLGARYCAGRTGILSAYVADQSHAKDTKGIIDRAGATADQPVNSGPCGSSDVVIENQMKIRPTTASVKVVVASLPGAAGWLRNWRFGFAGFSERVSVGGFLSIDS
ncbi:hypothetical protein [Mycobacterium uberis]|uniref:hypothetical protein n=1 Tax=Mycobacterium uberis TaxID=2162698 RepID=UPI001FB35510|nr:hypothetical protein [Mycobacterium uberis]